MKIGTHNGKFHCDEVVACMMLTRFTQQFKDAVIKRTRDLEILAEQDIVVDVGGVYDHSKKRYDHHQKEFNIAYPTKNNASPIRMSSAGLIYLHYGREVIANCVEQIINNMDKDNIVDNIKEVYNTMKQDQSQMDGLIDELHDRIYFQFVRCIDAIDNGVDAVKLNKDQSFSFENVTGLECRINRLNPYWTQSDIDQNKRFEQAMELAYVEFLDIVKQCLLNWYPARPIVKQAINNRDSVSKSGKIIYLQSVCPWKEHLLSIESQMKIENELLFVIFQDTNNKEFRVQAINLPDSFDLRKGLKKEWRGITDRQKLIDVSGIHDIVFCHNSGFIGGTKSYETAVLMAEQSLFD